MLKYGAGGWEAGLGADLPPYCDALSSPSQLRGVSIFNFDISWEMCGGDDDKFRNLIPPDLLDSSKIYSGLDISDTISKLHLQKIYRFNYPVGLHIETN